jgi:hypothetical protein
MLIDCSTCTVRDVACADCVVSFLTLPVRTASSDPTEWTASEARAVEVLAASGLVPPLRQAGRPRGRTG